MTDHRDARPSLRCQPIASLATRRRAYWREVIAALSLLGFLLAVVGGLSWAAVQLYGASWLGVAVVCAAILAPPMVLLARLSDPRAGGVAQSSWPPRSGGARLAKNDDEE